MEKLLERMRDEVKEAKERMERKRLEKGLLLIESHSLLEAQKERKREAVRGLEEEGNRLRSLSSLWQSKRREPEASEERTEDRSLFCDLLLNETRIKGEWI